MGCTSQSHNDRQELTVRQDNQETAMVSADNPIDVWWNAFQAKSADIGAMFSQKTAKDWDLPQWMQENLEQIHPQLMWEFGPAVHTKGHRLVITPEARRDLRPLVDSILRRAPKLSGWEFYGYRLPEDFDSTVLTVNGRSGGDVSNTSFHASIGVFNKIDLSFVADGYSANDQQALSDVFIAAESLLGEEVLDKWIGGIDVDAPPPKPRAGVFHIVDLKKQVDTLIEQVRSGLPDQPYHRLPKEQQWTLFKLEPDELDDYPHQWDMFIGKTIIPEMWQNAHSNQPFDSLRFSKNGEVFCYIKIDGTEGLDEEKFADKAEIEDTLDGALRDADVGCFIGGGTGLKYSYVDIVLTDLEGGASIVKRVLQEGNIPKRSWLLFFDTDLKARWIDIWDDAPPPPLPEFD